MQHFWSVLRNRPNYPLEISCFFSRGWTACVELYKVEGWNIQAELIAALGVSNDQK
jgi:hypothetical protein